MIMLIIRSVYLIRMWKRRWQASYSARIYFGIEITVARWRGNRRFFMIRNFRTYFVHRSQAHSPQTMPSLFTPEDSIFVDTRQERKISSCKSFSWMVGYGEYRIATSCTPMRDIGQLLQFLCIISCPRQLNIPKIDCILDADIPIDICELVKVWFQNSANSDISIFLQRVGVRVQS